MPIESPPVGDPPPIIKEVTVKPPQQGKPIGSEWVGQFLKANTLREVAAIDLPGEPENNAAVTVPSQTENVQRQKEVIPQAWDIIAGKGIEVVQQSGWEAYRKQLDRLSWLPIARTQIDSIKKLQELAKHEPVSDASKGMAERENILQYADDMKKKYPKSTNLPFFVPSAEDFLTGTDDSKKLYVQGKECPPFYKEKATRVYMGVAESGYREGFDALREELAANGALEKMLLVLNLETLQDDDPHKVDNNAFLMYVPDSNPEVLAKICSAIKLAKEKSPDAFYLDAQQLANTKSQFTYDFMIPLDDTTGFVEVEKEKGPASYHTSVMNIMRKEVYHWYQGINTTNDYALEEYEKTLNFRRPEIRNTAKVVDSDTKKVLPRRLAMPGLVAA